MDNIILEKTRISIPPYHELVKDVPAMQMLPAVYRDVMAAFGEEFFTCISEAARVPEPKEMVIIFNPMRVAGTQYIWEFEVKNLIKPDDPRKINWHGQDTSQWAYAGCILLQNGRVSRNH